MQLTRRGLGIATGGAIAGALLPTPTLAAPTSLKLGTSWGLDEGYLRDVRQLSINCRMVYWPAGAPHVYSNKLDATVSGHDCFLSVDGDPLFDVSMMPRVMELWAERQQGRLYVMARQEPEKNWTPAQWRRVTRELVVMAKDYPRVLPSMGFTAYAVRTGVVNDFYSDSLGLNHSSWSCYALLDSAGIPKADPVEQINRVANWAAARDMSWTVQAAGYPLSASRLQSQTHVNRRINWVRDHINQADQRRARHYPWFNVDKGGNLDYLIQHDPEFEAFMLRKFR